MKLVSLLKTAKKIPYLNMNKKKRSNKGVMWASIISIGVSTLMMMLSKGKRGKVTSSFLNFTKNITSKSGIPMMNNAALTEFSEEFHSKNIPFKGEASKQDHSGSTEFGEEFQSKQTPANGEISKMNDAALTEFGEEMLSKSIENK